MSRRTWILWLMLALLPMRLWAASVMPAMAVASEAPCHEQAATEGAPAAEPSCCATCDLCHGTPADIALPGLPLPDLPDAGPAPSTPRDTGRTLTGRLDRPPRHFLA